VQRAEIEIERGKNEEDGAVRKAEVDEMQSFVGKKEKSALVMACNRPSYRRDISLCVRFKGISGSVFGTKEVIRAFRNQNFLYRWFKNLRKASHRRDATSEQVENAEN